MALHFRLRLAAAACLGLAGVAQAADAPRPLPASAVSASADQKLADTIAARLAQSPGLAGFHIEVSCVGGGVELTGTVASARQQADVTKIVSAVKGVKKIDNKLEIRDDVKPVQAVEPVGPEPGMLPGGPGMPMPAGPDGYGMDPAPIHMPPTAGLYDGTPPRMPPYAWPTYAPYNNYSRVGYPTEYPSNAFPFIGPFYPFPKVPLGYRAIKLEWEDGHWYYGRTATTRDWWKVRYW